MSGFAAIVLAGDRNPDDPLLLAKSSRCKALIAMDGVPMVERVLNALGAATGISELYLSGPGEGAFANEPRFTSLIAALGVRWRAPETTPSTSAYAVLREIPEQQPVLLTSADVPLLQACFVEHFCSESLLSGADVTVGLAPYALVQERFPEMKKTVLRFRDGDYCGCNLFAFMSPAGRVMADRWREVEAQRKSPLKVIRMLGWSALLRYRLGLLSLDAAMALLSRRFGLRLVAVRMPFADAAVDVDSVDDHRLVEARLVAMRQ